MEIYFVSAWNCPFPMISLVPIGRTTPIKAFLALLLWQKQASKRKQLLRHNSLRMLTHRTYPLNPAHSKDTIQTILPASFGNGLWRHQLTQIICDPSRTCVPHMAGFIASRRGFSAIRTGVYIGS